MSRNYLVAVTAPLLFAASAYATVIPQSQFVFNQPLGDPATLVTFSRYSGPEVLQKAEFFAQATVTFRFECPELNGSGIPWNLYTSLSQYGFASDLSLGAGAPLNFMPGPATQDTTPAVGSAFATITYELPAVTTTYTDPSALSAFFVGSSTFSYLPAAFSSASVDTFVYSVIGTIRPVSVTTTVGVNLVYTTAAVPESDSLLLFAPAAVLLRRRR